jgi:hypothetical protein
VRQVVLMLPFPVVSLVFVFRYRVIQAILAGYREGVSLPAISGSNVVSCLLRSAMLVVVWAVLSAVLAAVLPLGGGGWATWAIGVPIFGAIGYAPAATTRRTAWP